MKKFLLIIINILLIIAIFVFVDFSVAKINYNKQLNARVKEASKHNDYGKVNFHFSEFHYSLNLTHFRNIYYNEDLNSQRRLYYKKNSNKGSIIVFGCSFAWGCFLEDNQTFEKKLSELANRTVHNRGYCGFGLSPMVWMSKNNDFYKDITSPEYIIFIYIYDHMRRIYEEKYGNNSFHTYVGYKEEKNHKLVEKYPFILWFNRLNIMHNFINNYIFKNLLSEKNRDKNFDLLKLYFEETRREFQKRYPNIKFIIIKHPYGMRTLQKDHEFPYTIGYSYYTPRWKELEDEGFIIYDLKDKFQNIDFESDEYTFPDGHPNEKAWDVVAKQLVNDLKL